MLNKILTIIGLVFSIFLSAHLFFGFEILNHGLETTATIAMALLLLWILGSRAVVGLRRKNPDKQLFVTIGYIMLFSGYLFRLFAKPDFPSPPGASPAEILVLSSLIIFIALSIALAFFAQPKAVGRQQSLAFTGLLLKNRFFAVIVLLIAVILSYILVAASGNYAQLLLFLSGLFILSCPCFDRSIIYQIEQELEQQIQQKGIHLKTVHFQQLANLKTIVVSQEQLVSLPLHEVENLQHRRTLRESSVRAIARQLVLKWRPAHKQLADSIQTENSEKQPDTGNVIHCSETGITTQTQHGETYMAGVYTYVKENIEATVPEDNFDFFVVKNEILLGKFLFSHKLNKVSKLLLKKLNALQLNTVIVSCNSKRLCESAANEANFDKYYAGRSSEQQQQIIIQLQQKAETALITNKEKLINPAYLTFYLTENNKIAHKAKCIATTTRELTDIPLIIKTIRQTVAVIQRLIYFNTLATVVFIALFLTQQISFFLAITLGMVWWLFSRWLFDMTILKIRNQFTIK